MTITDIPSAWKTALLSTSPLAWWRFGELNGTTAVEEIQGVNGTYSGTLTLGVPSLTDIDSNPSALMISTTGAMTVTGGIPGSSAANFSAGCWYQPPLFVPTGTTFDRIVEVGLSDDPGEWALMTFWTTANGQRVSFRGQLVDATGSVRAPTVNYAADPTPSRFVAISFDGVNPKLYVDGYEAGRGTVISAPSLTHTPIVFAGRFASGLTANIDEAFFHATVLTQAQIRSLFYTARPSSVRSEILSKSPRRYWRLGDFSSSTVVGILDEVSVSGTNYLVAGASGQQRSPLVGDPDSSFLFDGIDDHIQIDTQLRPTSLSAWVKTAAGAVQRVIWSNRGTGGGAGPAGRLTTYVDTDGRLSWFHQGTGAAAHATAGMVGDDVWHHIVITDNGLEVRFYVDGILVGTPVAYSPASAATSGIARIGHDQGNGSRFLGLIDELALFDTVLSATDVADIYEARLGTNLAPVPAEIFGKKPRNYWRLNDRPGSLIADDLTGNADGVVNTAGTTFGIANPGFAGDIATAADFDGSQGRINVGAIPRPSSFVSWFKTDGASGFTQMTLWSNEDTVVNGKVVTRVRRSDGLFGVFCEGQASTAFGTTNVMDDIWHMGAWTYDGVDVRIYIDGNLQSTVPQTWAAAPAASNAHIAFRQGAGLEYWSGQLADMAIFDTVLSTADIQAIYAARLG